MPYIRKKSEEMQKVFLDYRKIPGKSLTAKAEFLGISRQLLYYFTKVGLSKKTAKNRNFEKYLKENNEIIL